MFFSLDTLASFLTAFLFTKSALITSHSALSTAVYPAQLIIIFMLFVSQKFIIFFLLVISKTSFAVKKKL